MKKLNTLLFATAMVALTSCLKDGNVNLGPGAPTSPPVIEWSTATIDDVPKNGNTAAYRLYARVYPVGTAITMTLQVDITGSDAAPSDITVGLATSPAAYAAMFPTTGGVSATNPLLPTGTYTMPSSVTIPKGSRSANVVITLNTTTLDLTKASYYLPVAITSTTYGGISGNYGTVIYQITPANKYDGLYNYTGTLTNINTGVVQTFTGTNAALITSATAGVTTTFLQNPSYASTAVYTFNATSNVMTAVSLPGFFLPSALDATVSGYNPTTKVIRAKYTAGLYTVDETYTYTGSRISTK